MNAPQSIPRLVIAGTASGTGKTTVMVALSRALSRRGLRVAAFKAGPDYLDPTYHARATRGMSQNLDAWMMGRDAVLSTFSSAARKADVALVEGVMGLFDGVSPTSDEGSTAQLAKWLSAPVLLVVDCAGMARTLAAIVQGCASFDRELNLAGVICNRIGSRNHLDLLRAALSMPPVLGGLPKEVELSFPERHLGLLTANDSTLSDAQLDCWSERMESWCDVDKILAIARDAAPLASLKSAASIASKPSRCRIGYAWDAAFHFYYEDNLRRLRQLGAELVPFSPISDRALPHVDGLYFGGGYPEVYAAELAANHSMRKSVACFAEAGGPIYAECGGLMYLCEGIRTRDGTLHLMAGLFAAEAAMRDRLQALGYVEVETGNGSILGPAGLRFRGHQFRYSELTGLPGSTPRAYSARRRRTGAVEAEGYMRGSNVLGTYIHAHWASNPVIAENLVAVCADFASERLNSEAVASDSHKKHNAFVPEID